jgi:hypothetical protein
VVHTVIALRVSSVRRMLAVVVMATDLRHASIRYHLCLGTGHEYQWCVRGDLGELCPYCCLDGCVEADFQCAINKRIYYISKGVKPARDCLCSAGVHSHSWARLANSMLAFVIFYPPLSRWI